MILEHISLLRELTLFSIILRTFLAMLLGGLLGYEREKRHRPAGFRTYLVVCLGSTLAMMVGLFIHEITGASDAGRIPAQVISGIGFLGAGTILVTRQNQVRGLTTAAGLWVAAIVGLCCGAGFYEGAVYGTALVLVAEVFFSKLEYRLLRDNREVTVYAEYAQPSCLEEMVSRCHMLGIKIVDVEITRKGDGSGSSCAVLALLSRQGAGKEEILQTLGGVEGVLTVVET